MQQETLVKSEIPIFQDKTNILNIPQNVPTQEKIKIEKEQLPYYKSEKLGPLVSYFQNKEESTITNPVSILQNKEDLFKVGSNERYITIEEKVKNRLSGNKPKNNFENIDVLSLSYDEIEQLLVSSGVSFQRGAPKNMLISELQRAMMN